MYTCKICGKEFETKEKLGGHVSGHARVGTRRKCGQKVKRNPCVFCGKPVNYRYGKYCSHECQLKNQQKEWEEKWISGEISGFSENNHWGNISDRIRTYLFNKYNNKCSVCGWGEINIFTGRIPLEVEHIDGNYKNNSPNNVTLLCPNCHSLTKTYRGANRGNGRKKSWHLIK